MRIPNLFFFFLFLIQNSRSNQFNRNANEKFNFINLSASQKATEVISFCIRLGTLMVVSTIYQGLNYFPDKKGILRIRDSLPQSPGRTKLVSAVCITLFLPLFIWLDFLQADAENLFTSASFSSSGSYSFVIRRGFHVHYSNNYAPNRSLKYSA